MAATLPADGRRAAPADSAVPVPCRVVASVQETEDTWTLDLEPPPGIDRFAPGQFNMLYAFGVGEVPISISGDPRSGGALRHTVRAVGSVTAAICAARPGEQLGVRGPYGSSWPVSEAAGDDLLIVAGGLGLAPLRPALLEALARRAELRRVVLLYGGRERAQLLYRDELERWAASAELELGVTVDSASGGWHGDVGVVTRLIERLELEAERTLALLCGPDLMMRFCARALRTRGVAAERIHLSIERNMKCAVTRCGRCVFGPTYACREGPVMRLSAIERFLGVREL